MIDSVAASKTFDETREYLKNSEPELSPSTRFRTTAHVPAFLSEIKLDPGFKVFFEWCKAHNVP